jgi:hypothetical protein
MPGMPYHLEKGAALGFVEVCLNDPSKQQTILENMRDPAVPFGQGILDDPVLAPYAPFIAPFNDLAEFVRSSWFGPKGASYWIDYEGDVEGIVRLTVIRALEVALGIPHGDPFPSVPSRRWPIEVLWHCSQRWFEGWLTFKQLDSTGQQGRVTLVFASPAHRGGDITSNTLDPASVGRPAMQAKEVPAADPYPDQGMWLITHKRHLPVPTISGATIRLTTPSGFADVTIPVIGEIWRGEQSVVQAGPSAPLDQSDYPHLTTVAPNLAAGGL